MKLRANSAKIQYAVILCSGEHDSPQLLVLAYADEKLLRSLIAKPSIIALGFASRSEADSVILDRLHQSVTTQEMRSMSPRRNGNQHYSVSLHFTRRRLADELAYWKGLSVVYRGVQCIFATAVLLRYSRNIVSATIRTALGV